MSSVKQQSEFSRSWPHVVKVPDIQEGRVALDVANWLWNKSQQLNIDLNYLSTYLSNGEFGFKDPKVAAEFKLIWG